MNWFLIALVSPLLWSITNHIDKHLISKYIRGSAVGALIIFSSLIGLFLLPFILIIQPDVLNINTFNAFLITINGAIYVLALLPYFYALEKDEASIVVPLFQLIPVFGYFLALIFLGEKLTSQQIFASSLVVLGAIIISIEPKKLKFKFQVFWLMILSSFLIALNGLIFKVVAIQQNFWVTSFWEYVGFVLILIIFVLFFKTYRNQFISMFKKNPASTLGLNGLNEFLNIVAKMIMNFATLLAPLALVWTINNLQPFFVLLIGILLTKFFPDFNQEKVDKNTLLQKIGAIIIMFIGIILINQVS
jgi:drug/metabolite transporter (DMT)-like permease